MVKDTDLADILNQPLGAILSKAKEHIKQKLAFENHDAKVTSNGIELDRSSKQSCTAIYERLVSKGMNARLFLRTGADTYVLDRTNWR